MTDTQTATGADLIGPLTAAEWATFRLGADDDPLMCCAETSEVRDAIFHTLRMGAEPDQDTQLRAVWQYVLSHGGAEGLAAHPLMRKLHAYYVDGRPALDPDESFAALLATTADEVSMWLDYVPTAFDLDTAEGRVRALGRIAPKLAHLLDPAQRAAAVGRLAGMVQADPVYVARVIDAFRANANLDVTTPTEPTAAPTPPTAAVLSEVAALDARAVAAEAECDEAVSLLAQIGDAISPTGERPEEALGTLVRDVQAVVEQGDNLREQLDRANTERARLAEELATKTEVARSNKRHAVALTLILERVLGLTVTSGGTDLDPSFMVSVGEIRRALDEPPTAPVPSRRAQDVLAEVAAERAAQDGQWGEQNHPDGTLRHGHYDTDAAVRAKAVCAWLAERGQLTWRDILAEEVAEVYAEDDPAKLRAELIQVAAVATAWAEAIDRRTAATLPAETGS